MILLYNRTFVLAHWVRLLLCVRMKPIFLYTHPCVSDRVRKIKPACEPVDTSPRDIRVCQIGFSRPIACRTSIRHRTYSTKVTSFPSNLPLHRIIRLCFPHARSHTIPTNALYVNRKIAFSEKFFHYFSSSAIKKVSPNLQAFTPLFGETF